MKILVLLILSLSTPNKADACDVNCKNYKSFANMSGYDLKTALMRLTKKSHKPQSYRALFDVYFSSDLDTSYENDGSILDIYSENPRSHDPYNFTDKKHKCGSYRKESDCFNREHLFPPSIFRKAKPYCFLHQ